MTKIGPKLIQIAQNCVFFCTFSVSILLKFLRLVDWGGGTAPEAPPRLRPTVHECNRRTDGRTDRRTDRITITKTVQRIASHGKNQAVHSKVSCISR